MPPSAPIFKLTHYPGMRGAMVIVGPCRVRDLRVVEAREFARDVLRTEVRIMASMWSFRTLFDQLRRPPSATSSRSPPARETGERLPAR